MALRTLGTTTTTILTAFVVGVNDLIPADVATLNNGIRADQWSQGQFGVGTGTGQGITPPNVGTVRPRLNQPYVQNGYLIVPNRGRLVLRNRDIVAFDATGVAWPIVVSGDAIVAQGATSRWVLT